MSQAATTFDIAIPVGEFTPRLGATLRSLARQSPRPAVALMDASGDARVEALADSFGDLITVRRHGPDSGQADAIAEGWEALSGEVLGWLNVDDYLAPDALARAAQELTASGADAVTAQSLILDEHGAPLRWHPAVTPVGPSIRRGCTVTQPSCFVRRAAIDAIGGIDRDRQFTMDWDLWVRLFDDGARFHHFDEALSAVIWAPTTKTGSFGPLRRAELAEIAGRHGGTLAKLKTMTGFALHHAVTYAAPRGAADAGRALARAVGRPGASVHGLYGDGRLNGESAWLPIFHEDENAKAGLAVRLEASGEAEATLETPDTRVSARPDGEGRALLSAEIPPGVMCRMALSADGPARFSGSAWIEPAGA